MYLMLFIYALCICLLVFLTLKVFDCAKALTISPLMTSGLCAACVIYLASLLPGVVGLLYTPIVCLVFIVLAVVALFLLRRFSVCCDVEDASLGAKCSMFTLPEMGLILLGLLGGIPLLSNIRVSFPWALSHPGENLGWDTVSYHFPSFIEFFQRHTLWSLEGPFQSYSFAFELIGNFFSQLFTDHWGLILADGFALVLLVASIFAVIRNLAPVLVAPRPIHWVSCGFFAVGMWVCVHSISIGDVGKNDVFMAACLIAALSFALEIIGDRCRSSLQRRSLLFLVSISVGLALATKPSALAFVPFFAVVIWFVFQKKWGGIRGGLISAIVFMVGVAVLGGFWLARNVWVYGTLSPVTGAWKLSVVANLNNPALYEVKTGSLLFVAGVLAILPGLFLLFRQRKNPESVLPLIALLLFHVVACLAFVVTPWAVFHNNLTSSTWDLRYGMALFVSAALIYSLTAGYFCSVISVWRGSKRFFSIAVPTLLILLGLPLHWQQNEVSGLPGYEVVRGLPKTEIYEWVQAQSQPMRIYSAGLRPYGLYGKKWSNTLFYDLHSTELSPLETGEIRIAAVVVRFIPDLILISVDPHSHKGTPKKPDIVNWMKERSDCFEEVYNDETVSGFTIKSGSADRLQSILPLEYQLMMGEGNVWEK